MNTVEKVKALGQKAVLSSLKEASIKNVGLFKENIAEEIEKLTTKSESKTNLCVACGLNNADIDKAFLILLETSPEKVFMGMQIVANLINTPNMELYLPKEEALLAEKLSALASTFQIKIVRGIINTRKIEDVLCLHMATAFDVYSLFEEGTVCGMLFSKDGKTLERYKPETKLSDLIDFSQAKAIYAGYQYWSLKEAKVLTVADASTGMARALTEQDCIVENTNQLLWKYRERSCDKCVFCREGLIQLQFEQKEITEGRGKAEFRALAQEIGEAMCEESLCSVGQLSSKCVISAFDKFSNEYDEHIKNKNCPANRCSSFTHIYIDPLLCSGCGDCMDECPQDCITGKLRYIHMIDEFDCTKCGKCGAVCVENAVIITKDKLPKLPDKLTKVGKFRKK